MVDLTHSINVLHVNKTLTFIHDMVDMDLEDRLLVMERLKLGPKQLSQDHPSFLSAAPVLVQLSVV